MSILMFSHVLGKDMRIRRLNEDCQERERLEDPRTIQRLYDSTRNMKNARTGRRKQKIKGVEG